MNSIEVRKHRFDFIWKVLTVCTTVLGTIIVYFYQNFIIVPNAGEIVFIGVQTLCILLLITGIKFLYKDFKVLQDNDRRYEKEKRKINIAYNDIFFATKQCIIHASVHVFLLIVQSIYKVEWMKCFIPTQLSFFAAMFFSFIFLVIPFDRMYSFNVRKLHNPQNKSYNQQHKEYHKTIKINTNNFKAIRWGFYSVFWFNLWYLLFFTFRGI